MAVTSSNLNRFSNFLPPERERKFKCGTNLEENANKKCHMKQLSFRSYRNIKSWANFEFTSFIVSLIRERERERELVYLVWQPEAGLMIGVQTVKIIKSDSSIYCMLGCSSGPERHWQRSVDVFAHLWVQALDTLSNFCDNNNIHSAIWMQLSFFWQIWHEF